MDRVGHEQRIQTVCLLILSVVAVGAALYWLRPVMIPFVLALFFSLALRPLISFQVQRLRVPHPLAIVSTLLLGFGIAALIGAVISASIGQLAANSQVYQQSVQQILERLARALPLEPLGIDPSHLRDPLSQFPAGALGGMLVGTTQAIVGLLSQSLIVLIFVVFLLIGEDVARAPASGVWAEVESGVERYIVTKGVLSAATGLLTFLVLEMLGIDLAMAFGLFAFLLNFVPSIGSIIATLLPLPVVLVSPEVSPLAALLAIALPGAIQFSIGNVLEPRVMGKSLDLHPVVILLALIFWGMLWGIPGMLLAAPITAIMKILFGRLDYTRPLAQLLAGRIEGLRNAP